MPFSLLFAAAVAAHAASPAAASDPQALVGKPAPDFNLPSDRGGTVRLSSYRGKQPVVVAFFPKAFTPGCSQEMAALGKDWPKFKALHAQVLGVSYDTVAKQHAFAVHCAAAFPFLSDDGRAAMAYANQKAFAGVHLAGRRTVVVDKAGVVRFVYDGMPDDAQLLKDLAGLK